MPGGEQKPPAQPAGCWGSRVAPQLGGLSGAPPCCYIWVCSRKPHDLIHCTFRMDAVCLTQLGLWHMPLSSQTGSGRGKLKCLRSDCWVGASPATAVRASAPAPPQGPGYVLSTFSPSKEKHLSDDSEQGILLWEPSLHCPVPIPPPQRGPLLSKSPRSCTHLTGTFITFLGKYLSTCQSLSRDYRPQEGRKNAEDALHKCRRNKQRISRNLAMNMKPQVKN